MTQRRRIVLNAAATYGRSLLALAMGLFSARWVLEALGQVDFGLYGVVGGLISFVSFLRLVLSASVARYYAYTIGSVEKLSSEVAEARMKSWFNTAFCLHLGLAVLIFVVGMPLCVVAVKNWLVIPPDRLSVCYMVAIASIVTTCCTIVTVPYSAMFSAKQFIVALTVYDLIRIFGMFALAYFLLSATCDRLLMYAFVVTVLSCGIQFLILISARKRFSYCRVSLKMMLDWTKILEIGKYAVWKFFGILGWSIRQNGSTFLINVFFGPIANAAFSVAAQFAAQSASLSSSLMTAITPALTTIAGTGNESRLYDYTVRSCKFPAILVVMLSCPLVMEMDYVLHLWLKNPPELAPGICVCMTLVLLVENLSSGLCSALSADSKIKAWQLTEFVVLVATFPATLLAYKGGAGFLAVGYVLLADVLFINLVRIYFCKKNLGMSAMALICNILRPVVIVAAFVYGGCYLIRQCFEESFLRLVVVSMASLFLTVLMTIFFALTKEERLVVVKSIRRMALK